MLDKPEVIETRARRAAVIRLTIPREQVKDVMEPSIGELITTIVAQGVSPAGPIFAHHLRIEPGVFDFELGVPVSKPVKASGRVQPSELPARRVARTYYRGPYEGLANAWQEFNGWMTAQGLQGDTDLWETYETGPEASNDPKEWRTELCRPIRVVSDQPAPDA